jgi:hypothetical protein
MTDEEKHEFCLRTTGFHAVFLPPSIYDQAERSGICMKYYVRQQPIPKPTAELAH